MVREGKELHKICAHQREREQTVLSLESNLDYRVHGDLVCPTQVHV